MKKGLLVLIFAVAACAQSPKNPSQLVNDKFNGHWIQVDYLCEGGEFTKKGKEAQDDIRSGQVEKISIFDSGSARVELKIYSKSENKIDYCHIAIQEKYNVYEDNTYEVFDTKAVYKKHGKNKCMGQEKADIPVVRKHRYELDGKTLKLSIGEVAWIAKTGKTAANASDFCSGQEVVVLKKMN